ncbi:MAG: FtsW/RodA/SpoVE family cell cycle protein [Propionibacteriaceae bacterium]|jgi:cell division protein FtsW (lipid II flippase)|nr:FtsW/RodA/SpoVE family cell cycle protein [Propionibacteriaceae bacterium]
MAVDIARAPAPVSGPAGSRPPAAGPAAGRRRRNVELALVLVAQAIGWGGFVLTGFNRDNAWPVHWIPVTIVWFGLGLALHLVIRWRAPQADPLLLPAALCLVGVGQAALYRYSLDFDPAFPPDFSVASQLVAVFLGVAGCVGLIVWGFDFRRLKSYPYLLCLAALGLILLPLIPGLGVEINGSRIWIYLGPFSLQPAEIAKLLLAAGFAAYLAEKRDLLAQAGRRLLGLRLTRLRDIGPLVLMWGVSLVVMMWERDLGTSMLFFGLIVLMLFVATGQARWLVIAALLGLVGGLAAWRLFDHVQRRVDFWLRAEDFPQEATQILSAQYGLAAGGLIGSGWGEGRPDLTPLYFSDMIAPSLGEEIGVAGLMALVVVYGVIGFRGLSLALKAEDGFTKLFATGLSFGFILQVFAIVGGSTRLLPLTGLTCPFLSQGGSSMIANWLLLGLLIVISNQVRRPAATLRPVDLADERTMTIDVRRLRRVATGRAGELLAFAADQVKEDDLEPVGPPDELTRAVPGPGAPDELTRAVPGPGAPDQLTRAVTPPAGDVSPPGGDQPTGFVPSPNGDQPTAPEVGDGPIQAVTPPPLNTAPSTDPAPPADPGGGR